MAKISAPKLVVAFFKSMAKGNEVDNPTGWRWTSNISGIAIFALAILHMMGIFENVSDTMIVDLVASLVVVAVNVATDKNFGVDVKRRRYEDEIEDDREIYPHPFDYDEYSDDHYESGLRHRRMQSEIDEARFDESSSNSRSNDGRYWSSRKHGPFDDPDL